MFCVIVQDIFLGICEETVNNWIRDDVVPMFWGYLSKFRQEAEENGGSQGFRDWLIDSLTAATEETIVALQDPQLLLDYLATAVGSTASRQPLTHWIGIHASVASPEVCPHSPPAPFAHLSHRGKCHSTSMMRWRCFSTRASRASTTLMTLVLNLARPYTRLHVCVSPYEGSISLKLLTVHLLLSCLAW
jgi:hypothetical protein